MNKIIRKISLCVVFALVVAVLAGCGLSEEDAVGTWSGTYTYNGNEFSVAFTLYNDGTYDKVIFKNGSLSSTETGDYEVKGNQVILYDSSSLTYHGTSTRYNYKNGMLENNDHYFMKN